MMKTLNTIEREINKTRLRIYEETKDMTAEERAERVNKMRVMDLEYTDFGKTGMADRRADEPTNRRADRRIEAADRLSARRVRRRG
jgi:hypothetical protein